MEKTEFIERAAKTFQDGCPRLSTIEATDAAEELWDDGSVAADLDVHTPEEMADEEMSCWGNDGD